MPRNFKLRRAKHKYTIEEERTEGEFTLTVYSDGAQQWAYNGGTRYFAERVVKPRSKRRKWFIVDRGGFGDNRHADTLYPPPHSGPYPDDRAARVALKVLMTVR